MLIQFLIFIINIRSPWLARICNQYFQLINFVWYGYYWTAAPPSSVHRVVLIIFVLKVVGLLRPSSSETLATNVVLCRDKSVAKAPFVTIQHTCLTLLTFPPSADGEIGADFFYCLCKVPRAKRSGLIKVALGMFGAGLKRSATHVLC